MYFSLLGCRYNSVTKLSVSNLNSISIGAIAKSVDYQPIMLRVDLWKIWVVRSEKLEADISSYMTSDIKLFD
jgi:hypothetical protein